jgi:hypothetical protein
LTGCNEAFIIDKTKRDELIKKNANSAEIIRPILRGRDIKRYGYEFADEWLIAFFPSKNYNIENYTAIKEWLINGDWVIKPTKAAPNGSPIGSGQLRLEQTGAEHSDFKSRKKTNNKWFETQDSVSYWEDFFKQKIMYSEIAQEPQFHLDIEGKFFPEATTFILTGEYLEFLHNAFNTKTITYFFKTFYAGGGLGENGYRYKKKFLENLPIPKPTDNFDYKNIEKSICDLYQLSNEEIKFILQ